jgi:hypothetical protein
MPQFSQMEAFDLLKAELETMKSQLSSQQTEISRLKAQSASAVLPALTEATSRRGMLKALAVGAASLGMAGIALTANGIETVSAQSSGEADVPGPLLPPAATVTGTFYKSITGAAFDPEANTTTYDRDVANGRTVLEAASTDSDFYYLLDLPQGAVITEVLWYFTKPTAGGNFIFDFFRTQPSSGNFINLYSDTTTAVVAGTEIQLVTGTATANGTLANRTVDNTGFSYGLVARLPFVAAQTFPFFGVRVGYTLPFGSQTFFLASPIRVAASTNSGGTLPLLTSSGNPAAPDTTAQIVQITGVVVNTLSVPAGARAIICSVTSVGATTAGNLRLYPDGAAAPTVNSLNIPLNVANNLGFNLTTAVIVGLSAAGKVKIAYNNSNASSTAGFSIDVVGYIL